MKSLRTFTSLFILLALSSLAYGLTADIATAWVGMKGDVEDSSQPFNITRISAGHYCVNTLGISTFNPVVVTLQTNGSGDPNMNPLFAVANSGWGDQCNPYSSLSIHIFTPSGVYTDSAFSVYITLN